MKQIEYFPEREKPRPRKAARRFTGFRLERGMNQVEDEAWEAVQSDPVIALLLECDAIKVTSAPASAETVKTADTVVAHPSVTTTVTTPKTTKPKPE